MGYVRQETDSLPEIGKRYVDMLQRAARAQGRTPRNLLQREILNNYNRVAMRLERIEPHQPEWSATGSAMYVYCRVCLRTVLARKADGIERH